MTQHISRVHVDAVSEPQSNPHVRFKTMKKPKIPSVPSYRERLNVFIIKADKLALLIAVLVFILLMFAFIGVNLHLQGTAEEVNYKSDQVRLYAACAISVTLPLAIDAALDFIYCPTAGYIGLRFASLVSLLMYCLVTIFTSTEATFVQIHLVLSFSQIFIQSSIILYLLHDLDKRRVFTFSRVTFIICVYFAHIIVEFIQFLNGNPSSTITTSLNSFFNYLSYVAFITAAVIWLLDFRKDYIAKKRAIEEEGRENTSVILVTADDLTIIILSIVPLIAIPIYAVLESILIAIEGQTQGSYQNSDWLCGVFVLRSFLTFFTCILPARIFKQKAIEIQYDNEVKASLVRYMSHEMRTPMNIIALGLELASSQVREHADPTEILHTLHELEFASSGALEILDNLLLYEKLERSSIELETTEENSLELLCASLTPLLKIASAGKIELNVLDPSRNVIEALKDTQLKVDKTLIAVMIRTLVSRAIRGYKIGGSINIDLEIKSGLATRQRRSSSLLSIGRQMSSVPYTLEGRGLRLVVPLAIPLSYEEQDIFLSDSLKLKREANEGGGGFALSVWISKRVIALHGGKIGVLQHGGRQALFVDLPSLEGGVSDSGSGALTLFRNTQLLEASQRYNDIDEERHGISSTINFLRQRDHMQLLVVDDSALNRKIIMQCMAQLGHKCIEADDGSVAVDIIRKALVDKVVIDAVLMDNEMPIMRGRDAVRLMREMGYTGIVLGVTGNALKEDLEDFADNGVDKVKCKPATKSKFEEVLGDFEGLETFGRPGVGRSPEDDMGRMHAIVPAFDAAKMQLLVVDDSALNRKIIVQVMKSLGHKCIEADDGSVAVDIIRKALVDKVVIDAVLMDNEMPIMRGRDAVRLMREMGYTGIVLGVTGNALKEDLEDFADNGADRVVMKPLSIKLFNDIMTELKSL